MTLPQTRSGPVTSSADWKLDSEELRKLFNSNTKAIIVNNPNNPLGKVGLIRSALFYVAVSSPDHFPQC